MAGKGKVMGTKWDPIENKGCEKECKYGGLLDGFGFWVLFFSLSAYSKLPLSLWFGEFVW